MSKVGKKGALLGGRRGRSGCGRDVIGNSAQRAKMHYIRFLKPPRFVRGPRSPPRLEAKITVTTDLGESFLAADTTLEVVTIREVDVGNGWERVDDGPDNVKEFRWRGSQGMRALEITMPFPRPFRGGPKEKTCRIYIKAKDENLRVESLKAVMEQREGGIVAVGSVDLYGQGSDAIRMAERVFSFASGEENMDVRIWEETGESIARHIWYGLLTGMSSFLSCANHDLGMLELCSLHILHLFPRPRPKSL